MEKINTAYEAMLSLLAELTLDASIRKYREERLCEQIDQALADRDHNSFIRLTNELKKLRSASVASGR